jgi:hypothetical protein
VVPVPASVKAAIKPTNQPFNWALPANAAPAAPTQTAAVVTPRLANGKPDLTGVWGAAPNPITGGGSRRCGPTQGERCKIPMDNFWVDYEWLSPSRFGLYGVRLSRVLGQVPGTRSVDKKEDRSRRASRGEGREARPAALQTANDVTSEVATTSDYGGQTEFA